MTRSGEAFAESIHELKAPIANASPLPSDLSTTSNKKNSLHRELNQRWDPFVEMFPCLLRKEYTI